MPTDLPTTDPHRDTATVDELRAANAELLAEISGYGLGVDLLPELIGQLIDQLIGPEGTPVRDQFEHAWERRANAKLTATRDEIQAAAARAKLTDLHLPGQAHPPGMNRAQRRAAARGR